LTSITEPNISLMTFNCYNLWRRITQLSQQLWARWQKE
jgi:hypothetical protein